MRLIGSELLKLRTTPRTTLALVIALLAIVVLGVVGTLATEDDVVDTTVTDVVSVAGFAPLFATIVGILVITWEYRHGTISQTFLTSPRRERVVGAKTMAAVAAGGLLAGLAIALALVITYVWVGGDPGVDFDGVWAQAGRIILAAGLWGGMGVGLGALIRSQSLAIVAVFAWLLIAEPLVDVLIDERGRYLPGAALDALMEGSEDTLSHAAGGLVAAAYAAAFAALGALFTARRDVT